MRWSGIKLGTIFGIQIFIDYSWFVIFALITWMLSMAYYPTIIKDSPPIAYIAFGSLTSLLFFICALCHELSHSLVAKKNGVGIKKITLFLFGGISELFEEPKSAGVEFKTAIAGPVTSFLFALIFWLGSIYLEKYSFQNYAVLCLTVSQLNMFLGFFNLLPGFPLDGGRILRSIIWKAKNNLMYATRVASVIGKFIAYLIILFGILRIFMTDIVGGIWLVFIGLFLAQAASQSYLEMIINKVLREVRIEKIFRKNIPAISKFLTINDLIENYFIENNAYTLPVIDEEKIVGVISLSDIRQKSANISENTRVYEVMRNVKNQYVFTRQDEAIHALKTMISKNLSFVSIKDNGKFLGILTLDDIADFLSKEKVF